MNQTHLATIMRIKHSIIWCGCLMLALVGGGAFYVLGESAVPAKPASSEVTIFESVVKQGRLPLTENLSVVDAIKACGGLAPFANGRTVRVYNPSVPEPAKQRLVRFLTKGCNVVIEHYNQLVDIDWPFEIDLSIKPLSERTYCRVMVNLNRPGEDATLLPGDVVIVLEKRVTF